ncbi:hypothetical protein E2493_05370 [Sphingomonas parva]|uniref:Lipoprotein n=1 Tax=Sphingomonas parva TaxID=2555898 RepID=A0A4Y8ZVD0_9SPHN|nr:hypothetical protein [Sphingomonas parva]TFI59272.1 hypothetical protein E2493_05370 [Sphingomonas parva]
MIRPILLLSLILPLAACGDAPEEGQTVPITEGGKTVERPAAPLAEGAERVECAVAGAETFEPVCAVERSPSDQGLVLTIRAPSGGFRRLLVTRDGRGVIAADGAMPAAVTPLGPDRIEVAIEGDRYRLPATVRPIAGQ